MLCYIRLGLLLATLAFTMESMMRWFFCAVRSSADVWLHKVHDVAVVVDSHAVKWLSLTLLSNLLCFVVDLLLELWKASRYMQFCTHILEVVCFPQVLIASLFMLHNDHGMKQMQCETLLQSPYSLPCLRIHGHCGAALTGSICRTWEASCLTQGLLMWYISISLCNDEIGGIQIQTLVN